MKIGSDFEKWKSKQFHVHESSKAFLQCAIDDPERCLSQLEKELSAWVSRHCHRPCTLCTIAQSKTKRRKTSKRLYNLVVAPDQKSVQITYAFPCRETYVLLYYAIRMFAPFVFTSEYRHSYFMDIDQYLWTTIQITNDALERVMCFLKPDDLYQCRLTCKLFCAAASKPSLWRPFMTTPNRADTAFPLYKQYAIDTLRIQPTVKDYTQFGRQDAVRFGKKLYAFAKNNPDDGCQVLLARMIANNFLRGYTSHLRIYFVGDALCFACNRCPYFLFKIDKNGQYFLDSLHEYFDKVEFVRRRFYHQCY